MLRTFFRHFIVLAILIASASAEITVSAVFNPPRVAQGDTARYIVEIKETSTQQQPQAESVNSLPIPQAGGLELLNGRTSTSTQTRIVNGAAEYSVSQQLIIDARASGVGRYSIPSYTFEYKGDTYRVPAATLEVIERPADAGPTVDELIFLKTDAPEKLYLGQTTPIQLKLYISEAVRLSGLNRYERNTDGFTVSDLPDSQESSEIYQGHRYRVLTWPLMITPIRSGPQGLDFEFSVTASLPGQNNRNDPFGRRGFGSSIFDDFFGRAERFTVYTEPTEIEVLPLPTANRPNSFTGAIGEFSLQIYTDHPSTEVGEPIMLSLEISGQGNFDRINGPTPPEGPDWRSYAPEARFQPRADNTPTRGTKRFDYMLIPQRAGALLIPEMKFAYFDPESKSYVELVAPPIEISVRPSNRHAATQALPPQGSSSLPLPQQMSTKEALLTLDYRPKPPSNRLDAPLQDARFWALNLALAAALFAAGYRLRHQRLLREDPTYAAHQSAKEELRTAAKAARESDQADVFYAQAQKAIRLAVTARMKQNHRSANFDQLAAALRSTGLDDNTLQQTRQLFAAADAHRFEAQASQTDLTQARAQLERILQAL